MARIAWAWAVRNCRHVGPDRRGDGSRLAALRIFHMVEAARTWPSPMSSLVEALAQVPDPRDARGRRHGLLAILLIGACAVLAGARSFVVIAEYAHDAGRAVLDVVGVGGRVPEESTIRRVLNALDAAALEAALHAWALAHLELMVPSPETPRREQRRVLALDGMTVRGARVTATSDSGERGGESALVSRPPWCRCSTRPAVSCWPRSRSRRQAAGWASF
jgi:hypothetical protein